MTAVETLLDWLGKNHYYIGNDLLEKVEELKVMEKQNLINAHKHGMELREYEIFDWLKCQDYDFLVEEIIESE